MQQSEPGACEWGFIHILRIPRTCSGRQRGNSPCQLNYEYAGASQSSCLVHGLGPFLAQSEISGAVPVTRHFGGNHRQFAPICHGNGAKQPVRHRRCRYAIPICSIMDLFCSPEKSESRLSFRSRQPSAIVMRPSRSSMATALPSKAMRDRSPSACRGSMRPNIAKAVRTAKDRIGRAAHVRAD